METVPYSRLPESYGRDGIKGRISEAIEKSAALIEELVSMPDPSVPSKEKSKLILEATENMSAALNEFHSLSTKEKEYYCFDDPSILKTLAKDEGILLMFLNAFLPWNPFRLMFLIRCLNPCTYWFCETPEEREANERREREANKRRSTLKRIEFVEAICKLSKKHHAICEEANQPLSTLEDKTIRKLLKKFYVNHKEANPRRSTLQQVQFAKALRKLLKKCHAIRKKTYKPLSTPLMTKICNAKLKTRLENNTVQQMHTAPAPGAPRDDGNCVPPSTQMPMALPSNDPSSVGASIDADPNHIENPGDEPSSSTEASPAQAPDITTSSSNGACDDGNRTQPSKQMVMALSSNDPASVGASIDDDPNHIEKPGDEPSSSMEAPPAYVPDITSSANGACDNGNLAPPSTQMPMALPSDEPVSVGASIDDPNHIDNPGDEPSSSTEASRAHVPDITLSSNGACDDGNPALPSTQMPMELPSNDPAPVGVSSDDDHPNDFENPRDGNRDLEDDDSNDIENPRDGNRDLEDADPNDIENPRDGNRDLEDDDPNDENPRDGNGDLEAMHNHAIPKEVLLMFALQVFQILNTLKSKDSLLSHKAEILQYCAEALIGTGFFCGLGVILLRNDRNLQAATKIMYKIGFYFTGLGFIATTCVSLGRFMFWILGFLGFLFSALYAYALRKGWIV